MTPPRAVDAGALTVAGRRLEVAAVTDIGPVREENEDAWLVERLAGGWALVLADGMGGHPGGAEAAGLATTAAARVLVAGGGLDAAVAAANAAVAGGRPAGMATTLVVAVVGAHAVRVANVGDSRAYHIGEGRAEPITRDHSWVAEAVAAGALPADAVRRDPRRNVVTRAVMGGSVRPDLFEVALEPGDVVLLCSDGLWEPLEDEDLGRVLRGEGRLADLLEQACDAALEAGGTDNVTAVACRITPDT